MRLPTNAAIGEGYGGCTCPDLAGDWSLVVTPMRVNTRAQGGYAGNCGIQWVGRLWYFSNRDLQCGAGGWCAGGVASGAYPLQRAGPLGRDVTWMTFAVCLGLSRATVLPAATRVVGRSARHNSGGRVVDVNGCRGRNAHWTLYA